MKKLFLLLCMILCLCGCSNGVNYQNMSLKSRFYYYWGTKQDGYVPFTDGELRTLSFKSAVDVEHPEGVFTTYYEYEEVFGKHEAVHYGDGSGCGGDYLTFRRFMVFAQRGKVISSMVSITRTQHPCPATKDY
jgi:hypothetical protein